MRGLELTEMNGVTSLHIRLFLYKSSIMAQRIPWDIYEAVIMLNALISLYNGDVSRKEAIESVSSELSERARAKGIEVDEFFRNINGIRPRCQLWSIFLQMVSTVSKKHQSQNFSEKLSICIGMIELCTRQY